MKKENIPDVSRKGSKIILMNDYWEVIHDKEKGGVISSIRFFNGTKKNFLRQPLYSHIARREEHNVIFYKQCFSKDVTLKVKKKKSEIEIKIKGHFCNEKGYPIPVKFEQIYQYRAWGLVKVKLEFIIEKKINDVCELGACNFYLTPNIDTIGYRSASYSRAYPPSPFCKWEAVGFSRSYRDSREPAFENYIPIYFCAIQKGVEGIEFYRGSNSDSWDTPFHTDPGQSIFTHERELLNKYFYIRCEPFCNWSDPHIFKPGRQELEYYLGLPFISKPKDAQNTYFHASINSKWPSNKDIKDMAEKNIKLLRIHDDNTWKPKSWPDGLYPPYSPDDMKEMDRVINTAHRYGMKIVPYFSLKEFHPICPAFGENAYKWKCWVDNKGIISGVNGPFGGYMCMKSGWLNYRKNSIDIVLKKHKFDGVYYDHMWFRPCRHPGHCGGHPHTDVDEVLDFYFWTRKRLGEKGLMFVHLSGCPSMVAENIADLVFVSEDFFMCRPLPGNFDPLCEFVPITPRHTVSSYAHSSSNPALYKVQHMACLLEGWPTSYSYNRRKSKNQLFLIEEFAKFKNYDLSKFKFIPSRKKPFSIDNKDVYAAVYYKPGKSLIYCANFSSHKKIVCLKSNLKNWKFNCKIQIDGYSSLLLEESKMINDRKMC